MTCLNVVGSPKTRSTYLILSSLSRLIIHPTEMVERVFKRRADLVDHLLRLMGRELKLTRWDLLDQPRPRRQIHTGTYNLFAVLVKRCLNEESAKSEAQSVVGVPDAGLPAWGAGLQKDDQLEPAGAN